MKLKRVLLTIMVLAMLVGALFVTASAAGTENYAKIVTQPQNVLVASGEKARVTVEATGDGLTYKWYYKDKDDADFVCSEVYKKDVYATGMNKDVDGRKVYCQISDKYGNTVTTKTVTLTRKNFAKIVTQPQNVLVASGEKARVTVEATGDGLTYKWYYKDKDDADFVCSEVYKKDVYATGMNKDVDGRKVYCQISDKYGNTVTTKTVTLTRKNFAKITSQPVNKATDSGKQINVTVKATGDGLTYKWYYKNKSASKFSLASATGNTFAVTMDSSKDGRQVYCVVKDKYGTKVTTKTVVLSIKKYAKITTEPKDVEVEYGKQAKVTVKATGDGLTYKWYYKNKGASKFTLASTTGNVYKVDEMVESRSGRQVYCRITDKYGKTVKTKTVTLTMKQEENIVSKGVYSDWNIRWTLDKDGVLTVYQAASISTGNKRWNKDAVKKIHTKGNLKYVDSWASNHPNLTSVYISSSVEYIRSVFDGCPKLKSITVSGSNPYYTSVNNVLYNKNKTQLLTYPAAKTGTPTVPTSVETIAYRAFAGAKDLTSINIPKSVKSINGFAFADCNNLKKVTLTTGLNYIEGGTFYNCTSLKTINIPSTVTYIGGSSTFDGCTSLESITVSSNNMNYSAENGVLYNKGKDRLLVYPAGKTGSPTIPSSVTAIAYGAFAGAENLKSISVPKTVKSIWRGAFADCSNLSKVTLTAGLKAVDSEVFKNCTSLKTINIPSTVEDLGGWYGAASVFQGCSSLESITVASGNKYYSAQNGILYNKGKDQLLAYPAGKTGTPSIPSSVTSIAYGAFSGAENLQSITIPKNIKSIGRDTFVGCSNLTNVVLSSGLEDIGWNAFGGCSSLEKITLPTGLKYIESDAFADCGSLKTIHIPASVTMIGGWWHGAQSTFSGCVKLESITVSGSNQYYASVNGILCSKDKSELLVYPAGKTGTPSIPASVKIIGEHAFAGMKTLKSITIPNTVKVIRTCAFEDCVNLSSVKLSFGLQDIYQCAFRDCDSLKSITIPASVKDMDSYVFEGCDSLRQVTFKGNAPEYTYGILATLKATAYYPKGNSTWTADVRTNMGGDITWKAQ